MARELDHSVPALGGSSVENELGTLGSVGSGGHSAHAPKAHLDKFVPPVLTPEQAEAIYALKPFLKAIGDANRLAILRELAGSNGLNVLDLADRLLLSQPLTSWHLHILKRARLVTTTNLGRQHIYRLNRAHLEEYKQVFSAVVDL